MLDASPCPGGTAMMWKASTPDPRSSRLSSAARAVMAHPGWLDLRDVTVVVLGAGAQMGPLVSLLRWGVHVVAVDLPQPQIWTRLLEVARASYGRLSIPVTAPLPATCLSSAQISNATVPRCRVSSSMPTTARTLEHAPPR